MLVPILLCLGMVIIPLAALGAGGGPARGVTVSTARRARVVVQTAGAAPATDAGAAPIVGSSSSVPSVAPSDAASSAPGSSTAAGATTPGAGASTGRVQAASAATPVVAPARTVVRARPAATTEAPTTGAPRPTTTTEPPTTTAPRPSQTGPASWYDAPAGTCAHQTLPFGTVVTITDLANGNTTTCRVEDRGPYEGGRIIDLAPDVFSRLAPTSQGVINVRISW